MTVVQAETFSVVCINIVLLEGYILRDMKWQDIGNHISVIILKKSELYYLEKHLAFLEPE